jgi:hypothetical protein
MNTRSKARLAVPVSSTLGGGTTFRMQGPSRGVKRRNTTTANATTKRPRRQRTVTGTRRQRETPYPDGRSVRPRTLNGSSRMNWQSTKRSGGTKRQTESPNNVSKRRVGAIRLKYLQALNALHDQYMRDLNKAMGGFRVSKRRRG